KVPGLKTKIDPRKIAVASDRNGGTVAAELAADPGLAGVVVLWPKSVLRSQLQIPALLVVAGSPRNPGLRKDQYIFQAKKNQLEALASVILFLRAYLRDDASAKEVLKAKQEELKVRKTASPSNQRRSSRASSPGG